MFYYITSKLLCSDGKMTEKEPESTALDLSLTDSALISSENDLAILRGFRERRHWIPRTYIPRAEYCNATSLPLHFYFGYQILQVRELDIGEVSYLFH